MSKRLFLRRQNILDHGPSSWNGAVIVFTQQCSQRRCNLTLRHTITVRSFTKRWCIRPEECHPHIFRSNADSLVVRKHLRFHQRRVDTHKIDRMDNQKVMETTLLQHRKMNTGNNYHLFTSNADSHYDAGAASASGLESSWRIRSWIFGGTNFELLKIRFK